MVTHLKHSEINKLNWDSCILASTCAVPYALSWYLDVVSPGWEALVLGNYEAVMPLTYRVKYGVSYVFTPPFVQQLGIFGKDGVDEEAFIKAIPAKYKYVDVNLNEGNTTAGIANANILLNLNNTYDNLYAAFTDNTKRNSRKAEKAGLVLKQLGNAAEVINLFKANKGKEVSFGKAEYDLLNALVKKLNSTTLVLYGVLLIKLMRWLPGRCLFRLRAGMCFYSQATMPMHGRPVLCTFCWQGLLSSMPIPILF
ncbi:MAG: hypothetical protein M0D57_07240 [Sphingobacteriales bacterium JAD_PAG50586_3]|nr:MAG: hypothetical protein M0D57_07240 [Sphingobacteriales bacterium JAD_PAG50586_3]